MIDAALLSCSIYEYGTYVSFREEYGVGATRSGMGVGIVKRLALVTASPTIRASMDVEFGIRYRLSGLPNGTRGPLTLTLKFPSPGVLAYAGLVPFTEDKFTEVAPLTGYGFFTWKFIRFADLLPGQWTFEVWAKDRKLCAQSFTVIVPNFAYWDRVWRCNL